MAKKAKYPSQKLTEEDKAIIGQISLKYLVKLYALKEKYQNPKVYADKVFLKDIHSKNDIAAIHTLAIAKNATSNHLHKPREINQTLANAIQKNFPQDFNDRMSAQESLEFLHPRELRKALKELEEMGVLDHITNKNEIRRLERGTRHAGKEPSSEEDDRDLGGKPSVYKVTQEFEKLKNVMEKPGAVELLYEQIAKSGLAYKLMKFQHLAFLHAAKIDERVLPTIIGFGSSFLQDGLNEKDIEDFKASYQQLKSLDDNQIEELADYSAKALTESRDYCKFFISMCGLLKL
jgi:DNA-binding Lrp family transcriptional regulator